MFLPCSLIHFSIVGRLRDREITCSALDHEDTNFKSCVWRTLSSHSSHHPQEVLLAHFSLYVHKGDLKPNLFILFVHNKTYIESHFKYLIVLVFALNTSLNDTVLQTQDSAFEYRFELLSLVGKKVKLVHISPNILPPIHRKDTHPSHPLYQFENLTTVIPHVTHEEINVCLQIIHKITTFLYFLIHKKQKQPYKAVICVRTLQSVVTHPGFCLINGGETIIYIHCTNFVYFLFIFFKQGWSSKLF